MTPMQRSLARLRDDGYVPAIVEHWNNFSRTRNDLFGFGDILAIRWKEVLMVQTTSYANVSARVKKITDSPFVGPVREAGIRIEVHGWRIVKGKATCRVVDLS